MILPGNWRGARDPLIQPRNGRRHVMQVTHYFISVKHRKPIIQHEKLRYRSGTGLIYRYRTRTSPKSTGTGIPVGS